MLTNVYIYIYNDNSGLDRLRILPSRQDIMYAAIIEIFRYIFWPHYQHFIVSCACPPAGSETALNIKKGLFSYFFTVPKSML